MTASTQTKTVNFLRGIPAEEALSDLIPLAAEGYAEAIRHYGTDVLQYGHFGGFAPLRGLIGESHGVDPDRVVIGNGGMEVISLFFKSLPRASRILVEATTYDRVILDAAQYGHELIGIEMTAEGLDLVQFSHAVTEFEPVAFYGIPFHHNPTGITYTTENRTAVENICRRQGVICAWDVCYQTLRYDGTQNEAIVVAADGPVLLSSFTKTISPGTKCGYIVLPKQRVDPFLKMVANTRINPNLPTQAFIHDFIAAGHYDHYLKTLCDLYQPRMTALNTALATHFPEAESHPLTGGFFAVLTLARIGADQEQDFVQRAAEAGVNICAGWDAMAGNIRAEARGKGMFMRLTFPACQPEDITWGIARIKDVEQSF